MTNRRNHEKNACLSCSNGFSVLLGAFVSFFVLLLGLELRTSRDFQKEMDFTRCLEILAARKHADKDCPCCTLPLPTPAEQESSTTAPSVSQLGEESNLQLLERAVSLQERRLEAYRLYDSQLQELIDTNALQCYPQVCTNVSVQFNSISRSILEIREECAARGFSALAALLTSLQSLEKEKLTLTAAVHLDIMRPKLAAIGKLAGEVDSVQTTYLHDKRTALLEQVNAVMEEIHGIKIDLLESSEVESESPATAETA